MKLKLALNNNFSNEDEGGENDQDEEQKGPALEIYGTDLTSLARQGLLEECFGREKELLELMEILVRRQKNNPVLVGDAGVGKTAIVELFATKIVNNLVPFILEGRSIISLDLSRIIAGSRYRGEFESRFQKVLDEVLAQPNTIIFIDEIHNLSGAGSAEGSLDAANILKPVLSRSGFQCIGATTTKEYQKIEKDPALNRRFQPIKVNEPSIEDTINIIYGLRPGLEAFHNVEILPGAIRLAAELSSRYIYDRHLPDKAIDLIDRAAAKEVIRQTSITHNSAISSIVHSGLKSFGSLRMEAFRRGDIASEYIFQELENAYRNFLLTWLEDPSSIPDLNNNSTLSPISQSLFDKMRLSVLSRVDELLFASTIPRITTRCTKKTQNLTENKNNEILLGIKEKSELTRYRISLLLFCNFIKYKSLEKNNKMVPYLQEIRSILNKKNTQYLLEDDFCLEDSEEYEETFEILSELEEKRIEIFKDFLSDLKPLLRTGIIESLKNSSELKINEKELSTIYALLGYFSTNTGREFLSSIGGSDTFKHVRKSHNSNDLKQKITQKEIRELLSDITGIPIQSITEGESQKLLNLEKTLHTRVIGQEEAVSAIAKAIRRSRLGIQNPNRPIASFLFCGPTGVGKTEVTKALAASMFGAENNMIRLDMSEFMEKFTISRLIGSPPGYVGYDDGGQLTDAVRQKPYSVVLFDEIEKAHPDILNVLLQILEDGRLTDSQKRLVSFENTVIIMTSNAASDEIQSIMKKQRTSKNTNNNIDISTSDKSNIRFKDEYAGAIDFLKSPITENFLSDMQQQLKIEFEKSFRNLKDYELLEKDLHKTTKVDKNSKENNQAIKNLKSAVLDRLNTLFLPEFLNRLDDIIIFKPLEQEELRKICDIMVKGVIDRVKSKKINLIVSDKVKFKLTQEGYNPIYGARPLRRLITKHIEDIISENILLNPINKAERLIKIQLNENDQIIAQ
jgi:ATP-dependent Clp protease ATP-binding subunit ClpA